MSPFLSRAAEFPLLCPFLMRFWPREGNFEPGLAGVPISPAITTNERSRFSRANFFPFSVVLLIRIEGYDGRTPRNMRRPPLHKGGGDPWGLGCISPPFLFLVRRQGVKLLRAVRPQRRFFFPGVDSQLVFFSCKFFSTNKISQLGDASGLFPTGARD